MQNLRLIDLGLEHLAVKVHALGVLAVVALSLICEGGVDVLATENLTGHDDELFRTDDLSLFRLLEVENLRCTEICDGSSSKFYVLV